MRDSIPDPSFSQLLVLIALLSGCGGETPDNASTAEPVESETQMEIISASPPPDIDPCALISQAEIEGILGISVAPPSPSIDPSQGVTYFSCSSDDIHINVQAWDSGLNATGMYEFGTESPPIVGIGEKARNTQPLGEIEALMGRYVLSVDVFTSLESDAELQAATEIAKIVLDRLP